MHVQRQSVRTERTPIQPWHHLILEGGNKRIMLEFFPPGSPGDQVKASITLKGEGSARIAEELRRMLESLGFSRSKEYDRSLVKFPEIKEETNALALPDSPEVASLTEDERRELLEYLKETSKPRVSILDRGRKQTKYLSEADVLPEAFAGSHHFHISYGFLGSNYYDETDFKRIYAVFCLAAKKFLPHVKSVRVLLSDLHRGDPILYDQIKDSLPPKPAAICIQGPSIPQALFSGAKIKVIQLPRSNREKKQPQWGPEKWGHWYRDFIFEDIELHGGRRAKHNKSIITYSISGASALRNERGKDLTQTEVAKRIVKKPMHPEHEEDSYWQPFLTGMRIDFDNAIPHAEALELGIKKTISPVPGFQRKPG